MFKLVGDEKFSLGKQNAQCELRVDPLPHFAFGYNLLVDGKPLEKFTERQSQTTRAWAVVVDGKRFRIVFGTFFNCCFCFLLLFWPYLCDKTFSKGFAPK